MSIPARRNIIALIAASAVAAGCSPRVGSEADQLPQPPERRETIWDLFGGGPDPNVTVAVNRYLWNASLEVLDFMPIETADPFSGVIVFGYGTPPGFGQRLSGDGPCARPGARRAVAERRDPDARRPRQPRDPAHRRGRDPDARAPAAGRGTPGSRRQPTRTSGPASRQRLSPPPVRPHAKPQHVPLRSRRHRTEMAGRVGRGRALRSTSRPQPSEILRARDVPLPVGAHPYRTRAELHDGRRHRPLQACHRPRRPAPDGLGRLRDAGGERGDRTRRPSRGLDLRQHRRHARADEAPRLLDRLEPRVRHLRPRILRPAAGAVPRHARGGIRLPQARRW